MLPGGSVPDLNVLDLNDVTKSFASARGEAVRAVNGVTMSIRSGELVALLGPNGAGKTTTIDMVLGLTSPSSGNLAVFGEAPHRAIADGRVSAVLQSGGLLADLTVAETMRMIASTFPGHTDTGAILERVGISKLANRRVSKCSGGEQQRLRFAMALIPDPDLLVLDEPTTGMDVGARREFWRQMHVEADGGRTVVFATHYLQEADEFAQRIIVMANGRIIADGSTSEIRAYASSRHVSFNLSVAAETATVDLTTRLGAIAGVSDVSVERGRVSLMTNASDEMARLVLDELGGTELEITSGSLDDAFVALTQVTDDSSSSTTSDEMGADEMGAD